MRIETTKLDLVFISLLTTTAADFQIKTFTDKETGKTTTKTAPDGRPVYRTDLKALAVDESGKPTREEHNISITVLEPSEIIAGIPMKATGTIWVTPYVTNTNRIGISIIAERLEPVTSNNGGTK